MAEVEDLPAVVAADPQVAEAENHQEEVAEASHPTHLQAVVEGDLRAAAVESQRLVSQQLARRHNPADHPSSR
jgi:hypothetical protein